MSKRLKKIQQIQKFQKTFTALTSKLFNAIKNDKPDDFKKMIMDYLMKQQRLNTEFSIALLKAIPKEVNKDRFDRIIKPLKLGGENGKT